MEDDSGTGRKRFPPPNELYLLPPATLAQVEAVVDDIRDALPNLTRRQAAQVIRGVEIALSVATYKTVEQIRLDYIHEFGVEDYTTFMRIYVDGEDA